MLEGAFEYKASEIPDEEYREYRLVTMMHCTPAELDEQSALRLDWLLAIDNTVAKAREAQERRAAHG